MPAALHRKQAAPGGAAAALVINYAPTAASYTVSTARLGLAAADVRDLWARSDGPRGVGAVRLELPAYDSAFLLLTPRQELVA